MTKAEHKKAIALIKRGNMTEVHYFDLYCGTYTKSWKASEIRENVYQELKTRNMLLK